MINKKLIATITLVFLTKQYLSTGEQDVLEEERVFFFAERQITFKNVCEKTEILNFSKFINTNSFLFIKHQADKISREQESAGLISENYPAYSQALQEHIDTVESYLNDLSTALSSTETAYTDSHMHNFQADYIKMLIKRFSDHVRQKLRTNNSSLAQDNLVVTGTATDHTIDNFEVFSQDFDQINEAFVNNLLVLVKGAATQDEVRNLIQESVCDGLVETGLDVVKLYITTNGFDGISVLDKILLTLVFDELKIYDFNGYSCGGNTARTHFISKVIELIFNKKIDPVNPEDFQYFLESITTHTNISERSEYSPVVKLDHDLIHVFQKFISLTLQDIMVLHKSGMPVSVDFLRFVNSAENKISELGLNMNTKEEENVPLEVFTMIYKLYLISRGSMPANYAKLFEQMKSLDGIDETKKIAKMLFLFVLKTNIWNEIATEESNNLQKMAERSRYVQVLDQQTFHRYRLITLVVLAKEFTGVLIEEFGKYNDYLENIFSSMIDGEELIPIEGYKSFVPKSIVDKHHGDKVSTMLKSFMKSQSIKESKFRQQQKSQKKKTTQNNFEDDYPELNSVVQFIQITDPQESPQSIQKKGAVLSKLVMDAETEFEKLTLTKIINKAAVTSLKSSKVDNKNPESLQKKIGISLLMNTVNTKLILTLLEKVNTPGLYQFLTYLSTNNNLNDLKVVKDSGNPNFKQRMMNFTLDKLLFIHKWYDINKERPMRFGEEATVQQHLNGPSADSQKRIAIMTSNGTAVQGWKNVLEYIVRSDMITKFYDSLKFMAELVGLFDEFSNVLTHQNGRVSESHRLVFVNLYNLILDIRSDDFDSEGLDTSDLILDKIHEIRQELLKAHLDDQQEKIMTRKHSLTYKEVVRVSYFLYYHAQKTFQDESVFVTQMDSNFGLKELQEQQTELVSQPDSNGKQPHNKFDFGGIAFEASDFIIFLYMHDREFIRKSCETYSVTTSTSAPQKKYYSIRHNGFCAQAMIFLNTINFLSTMETGTFEDWYRFVFEDPEFAKYVLSHKGIIFAAFEIINREANMLGTLHSERLKEIIDDEQNHLSNKKTVDFAQHRHYESVFKLSGDVDKTWLVNYMYVNFERAYTKSEKLIFEAFEHIITTGVLSDLFITSIKGHYSDVELEAKAFVMEAFRVTLLFTQRYSSFEKIAEFLMRKERSHLLIYLKRENDNRSEIVDMLLDKIAENKNITAEQLAEIIKQMFDERFKKTVEICQDEFMDELDLDDLDNFGNLDDEFLTSNSQEQKTLQLQVTQKLSKLTNQSSELNESTKSNSSHQKSEQTLVTSSVHKGIVSLLENNRIQDSVQIRAQFTEDDSLLGNIKIKIGTGTSDALEITNEDLITKRENLSMTRSSIAQSLKGSLVEKKRPISGSKQKSSKNQISLQLSNSFTSQLSEQKSRQSIHSSLNQFKLSLEKKLSASPTSHKNRKKILI